MWAGVFPAVTTKFTTDDHLDHAEMERCFGLQMDAGCDGIIVCGSLGEGPMLSHDEKIDVLKTARKVAGKKPVLMTINEAGTREAAAMARRAAREGADGLMVVPSPIYHTNAEETVAALRAVAQAGDLPLIPDPFIPATTDTSYGFAAPGSGNSNYFAVIMTEKLIERPVVHGGDGNLKPRIFQLGLLAGLQGQYVGVHFSAVVAKRADAAHAVVAVVRPTVTAG